MKTFILFFVFGFILHDIVGCSNNKKEEIVDQLFLYRDSLGMSKAQLMLVDTNHEDGVSYHDVINLRKPIKERIYRYEWKLDSLELELKKY